MGSGHWHTLAGDTTLTGIAVGLVNIPKIALGSTEIKKVSLGAVDVWPPTADVEYHYGIWDGVADLDSGIIVTPAWATRASVCVIGLGGATTSGGGGGGGPLAWLNFNVAGGSHHQFTGTISQFRIIYNFGASARITAFPGGNGLGNNGGAGGTINLSQTAGLPSLTSAISTGGPGNSIFSGGQAAGGGGSGNYGNGTTGATGVAGGSGATAPSGSNGGGGGGGSALVGVTAGRGGRASPFGQGANGAGGAYANNGGDGSIVTGPGALILGGGGAGGFTAPVRTPGCWAIRFHTGQANYPLQVIP